jgi:hypothetical protein
MKKITKSIHYLAVTLLASFFPLSAANAANTSIYTSAVWADHPYSYHACNISNLGTGSLTVVITLYAYDGPAIQTSTANILGGQSYEMKIFDSGFARCQFTYPSTGKVRANISVFHNAGTYYDTLAFDSAK